MAGFVLIDDQTLDTAAASITFSDLSAYTTFRLTLYGIKGTSDGRILIRFNGDTGNNYTYQQLTANLTSLFGERNLSQNSLSHEYAVSAGSPFLLILEASKPLATVPARATYQLSYISSAQLYEADAGQWNNTADLISSISILPSAGNFAAGTRAVLEGWTDNDSATLSPVTFTLTSVAPAFILGTPALFKTGSYIPIITKKKVG